MQKIGIQGERFSTIEEIHEFLQSEMDFPEYYGGNLSALYDMLTDICEETYIYMDVTACQPEIREYLERISLVLLDAEEDNPRLTVEIRG